MRFLFSLSSKSGACAATKRAGGESSTPAVPNSVYYVVSVLLLAMVPTVTYPVGSGGFFASQATIWGLASYFFCKARQQVWESAGMADCRPERRPWPESAPAWAFEASFMIQLVNVPFFLAMTCRVFASRAAFDAASTKYMSEFPQEDMWIEHVIFSSLFGFMVRDLILHRNRPDLLLFVHHVGVIFLMYSFAFCRVVGTQLLAWMTPTVELGTSAFCAWVVWRTRISYQCIMHASNFAMFLGATLCLYNSELKILDWALSTVGYGLVIGRTDAVFRELKKVKV